MMLIFFKIFRLLTLILIVPAIFFSGMEIFNLLVGSELLEIVSKLNKICIRALGTSFIAMIVFGILDKSQQEK